MNEEEIEAFNILSSNLGLQDEKGVVAVAFKLMCFINNQIASGNMICSVNQETKEIVETLFKKG